MLQRSQGLTVAPESTVPCREYVMYWSQSKLVKVCKAIKVFLPQQTTLFYLPLSHIQLWRVRVISGFQLCVIEPCFASGPCSFIRVLVDGAVLGAEVTLLWLSWCPDITTQKRKQEVVLCWNTQLLALWQHVVTLSPFVKLTNQLSLSYTSRLRALHCRFSRQKFPQWAWCLDRTGVITHCSPLWHDGPSNTIIKTHGFSSVSRDQSDSSDLASAGIVSPCQRRRDCGCFSFFVKIHISNKK